MNTASVTIRRAGTALSSLLMTTTALGAAAFSPRDFCEEGGGAVLETGNPDVYICCYTARQECLAVNAHSRLSVRVNLPGEASYAAPAMNGPSADAGNGSTGSVRR